MTDRKLILLRHSKSQWPEGVPDPQRPLAPRGRRDAPVAGKWLSGHAPDIDLVLHSPAERARQTWILAAAEWGGTARVRESTDLYDASAEDLLAVVRLLPDTAHTVLFVGHNPGLEDLVALLTGVTGRLRTSGIAVLTGSGRWSDVEPGWASTSAEATPRGA
jgi:phosphohistidine phosphatase